MHPDILETTGDLVFVPVRHHSPACARAVRTIARALRPAAILIEGPSDFNRRLDELYLPHGLPIAIYSYIRQGDARLGAFYPFCEHSPEWQALLVAREVGAAARFIDLPWRALATTRTPAHRYADGELRDSPYIPTLCQKLGVEDFDGLWDQLAEIDPALPATTLIERVHHFCYHLRASGHVSEEDLRREAFMAQQIRAAQHEHTGPIMVVTGGFHSFALWQRLREPAAFPGTPPDDLGDAALDADDHGIALTPFTDARLDSLTGYDAGMPSPGFYRRVWHARTHGQNDLHHELLVSAATALRRRGQFISTADLIAVETGAQALAALRGHAVVWRRDLIDAITGALIKEALEPDTRHPFLDALLQVLRGDTRGTLAEGVLLPPLVYDIRAALQRHDLEPHATPRTVRLDLLLFADLERSRVLHRLRALAIRGFVRRGGSDLVGRADLTELWEAWEIVWSPDFDAGCIEAAIYGATLADAAAARVNEQAAAREPNAEGAALLLLDACLMGLGAHSAAFLAQLAALVRQDGDFFSVAAALEHVLYVFRYDATLGALGRGDVGALLAETWERALWLLELLGRPQGQDRALLRAFGALVHTFESCQETLALDRDAFAAILSRAAGNQQQSPLLRGAATGALWTLHAATFGQVRADLRGCAAPERLGDFLTGLFALARETAQRNPELLAAIDELVMEFDDAAYLHALPALRLAFSFFTPREKHYLARTLLGTNDAALPALEVDVAVATRALAVESHLLTTLARFGVRGATP